MKHVVVFVSIVLVAPWCGGQCMVGQPDGFDPLMTVGTCSGSGVACCGAPAINLPPFSAFGGAFSASYMCHQSCVPGTPSATTIQLGAPAGIACDLWTMTVSFAVAGCTFSGTVNAKYARTWKIVPTFGQPGTQPIIGQVWRFLLNGDLSCSGVSPTTSCPIPPCVTIDGSVHWVGHMDLACLPEQDPPGQFHHALSLSHLPGCIAHNSASLRPYPGLAAHNDASYHIVSPGTFVWFTTPTDVPAGPILGDTIRTGTLVGQQVTCLREDAVANAGVQLIDLQEPECLCIGGPSTTMWHNLHIPPNTTSLATCVPGTTAWFWTPPPPGGTWPAGGGLVALHLGDWALGTTTFPFDQRLSLLWGALRYVDPCGLPGPQPDQFITGVYSRLLTGPGPAYELWPSQAGVMCLQVKHFLDFQNSKVNGATWQPAWGAPFRSDVVLSLNL